MLNNQIAVISGALGDIGRAIALRLARDGAGIALADLHSVEDASSFVATIKALGVPCRYHRVDVGDVKQVQGWIETIERELGVASLIIPNAAIVAGSSFQEITPQEWSDEININLNGAFHLAQAGVLRLIEHKREGRVVFIGSWAAHAPHPTIPAYCAAKAGLRMLCKCMALELAPLGILVNEVAPGYVDAGLTGKMFQRNPGTRERATERVPIGRLITADEVAANVAFLCDPQNRQMTGTTLLMDGGLSLGTLHKK